MRSWAALSLLAFAIIASAEAAGRDVPRPESLARPFDRRFAEVRKQIQEAIDKAKAPSIAVAVAVEGKIVWEEGFGWADKERRIAATAHTRYPIASVSKPFVATGVMVLAERGLVDLDRPVNSYLSSHGQLAGHAGDASAATMRHVLQHRAGLPVHFQWFSPHENHLPPSIDETIRRYAVIVNPVDERYTYSNLGYGILALISARTSARSYADFMRTELFEPLGLANTSLEIEPQLSREAAALYAGDGTVIPYPLFDEWGGGRVWSTAHDVVRFGMFHLKEHLPDQKPILKDATIDLMASDARPSGTPGGFYGTDWFYGLGWGGRDRSAYSYRWYGHDGRFDGASSQLKLFPEQRIAIVVLSNGSQELTYDLADRIAEPLLPDFAAMRSKDPTKGKPPATKPFAPTPELLGAWQGEIKTWSGTHAVTMTFQPDADVHVRIGDGMATLVNNISFENGRFRGDSYGAIPTQDVMRSPHAIFFTLTLRGDTLSGAASAKETSRVPKFFLPSWITLKKQPRAGGT